MAAVYLVRHAKRAAGDAKIVVTGCRGSDDYEGYQRGQHPKAWYVLVAFPKQPDQHHHGNRQAQNKPFIRTTVGKNDDAKSHQRGIAGPSIFLYSWQSP